jgi:hypothetical protein
MPRSAIYVAGRYSLARLSRPASLRILLFVTGSIEFRPLLCRRAARHAMMTDVN